MIPSIDEILEKLNSKLEPSDRELIKFFQKMESY